MEALIRKAVNALIRPPRMHYDQAAIPLCLKGDDSDNYLRLPLGFVNQRNIQIAGSLYLNSRMDPNGGGPCVIYLHGNASSQLEGQFLVPNLCKYGIYVYCFDFAGCGCSGGKYVSLGYFEKYDTEFILDQLHTQFNLGPFVLWGRSMGAATTLLVDYPLLAGRISDSSFTSIPDLCSSIANSMHLSPIIIPLAILVLKKRVIHKAKFNIDVVSPINHIEKRDIPAVFGHGENDQFIPLKQCRELYQHYPSKNKDIVVLSGGHNSKRTENWIRTCVEFILKVFDINVKNPKISKCRKLQESVFHFSSFNSMMDHKESPNKKEGKGRKNRKRRTHERDSYYHSKNHWRHHKSYKFRRHSAFPKSLSSKDGYKKQEKDLDDGEHHEHRHRKNDRNGEEHHEHVHEHRNNETENEHRNHLNEPKEDNEMHEHRHHEHRNNEIQREENDINEEKHYHKGHIHQGEQKHSHKEHQHKKREDEDDIDSKIKNNEENEQKNLINDNNETLNDNDVNHEHKKRANESKHINSEERHEHKNNVNEDKIISNEKEIDNNEPNDQEMVKKKEKHEHHAHQHDHDHEHNHKENCHGNNENI